MYTLYDSPYMKLKNRSTDYGAGNQQSGCLGGGLPERSMKKVRWKFSLC